MVTAVCRSRMSESRCCCHINNLPAYESDLHCVRATFVNRYINKYILFGRSVYIHIQIDRDKYIG